jgi:hypothetical protein
MDFISKFSIKREHTAGSLLPIKLHKKDNAAKSAHYLPIMVMEHKIAYFSTAPAAPGRPDGPILCPWRLYCMSKASLHTNMLFHLIFSARHFTCPD